MQYQIMTKSVGYYRHLWCNGVFSWHINHCGLFNAKSILYIYTILFKQFILEKTLFRYVSVSLFNGILNFEGYLMPKPSSRTELMLFNP